MKWVVRIIQGLLVIAFLFAGGAKLAAVPMQVEAFTKAYGYGVGFMYVVGVIEVLAAIALLIGFWKPKVSFFVAGVLALTMVGAVFTHLNAGQGMGAAIPASVLLILNLLVLFGGLSVAKKQKETA
ncbi:DoxX family protein [Laceyella putida]|uniref:DoxX family protein n=1 Tax=Laceyella putida TaxID=110101 RepID=A0ABW2RN80_9BACL